MASAEDYAAAIAKLNELARLAAVWHGRAALAGRDAAGLSEPLAGYHQGIAGAYSNAACELEHLLFRTPDGCACAAIQSADPRRHFQGCPLRQPLDDVSGPPNRSECTGIAAGWCPVHGDCTCERLDTGERAAENPACPLHASSSTHADPPNRSNTEEPNR